MSAVKGLPNLTMADGSCALLMTLNANAARVIANNKSCFPSAAERNLSLRYKDSACLSISLLLALIAQFTSGTALIAVAILEAAVFFGWLMSR